MNIIDTCFVTFVIWKITIQFEIQCIWKYPMFRNVFYVEAEIDQFNELRQQGPEFPTAAQPQRLCIRRNTFSFHGDYFHCAFNAIRDCGVRFLRS